MLKRDVLHFFGGVKKTAAALNISHPAVCRWKKTIPEKQALIIERITNGGLKYNPALYQHSSTEKHS